MGTCRYCGQNAGFLRRQHGQCDDLHATGIQEMTQRCSSHDHWMRSGSNNGSPKPRPDRACQADLLPEVGVRL